MRNRTCCARRICGSGLARLLGPPDPSSKRLNLRDFAARVRYRVVGSQFELSFLHWQHARRLWPGSYRERARLRPPAVLKVSLENAYPRCYATRRITSNGFYFGPFASRRAAETFASGFLDLFKIRRCQIKIRRDPTYPGCIYSEMKMCLAPCFAGCTKEDYDAEVGRVVAFLATGGGSLTAELEREREAASEALDFERAAAVHRRIEKAAEALRGLPDLARRLDDLNAVVLQRAAEENTVSVFWCAPVASKSRACCASRNLPASPARSNKSCASGWKEWEIPFHLPQRQPLHSKAIASSRTNSASWHAGSIKNRESGKFSSVKTRRRSLRRRAARRGQRAPEQRVAVSPAFCALARVCSCRRQLKVESQEFMEVVGQFWWPNRGPRFRSG